MTFDLSQMLLLAFIGAVASYILSNRRIKVEKRRFIQMHIVSMTQLGEAAMEVLCVDYEHDVEEAMAKLQTALRVHNPNIVAMAAKDMAETRKNLEAARAKKRIEKEKANESGPANGAK